VLPSFANPSVAIHVLHRFAALASALLLVVLLVEAGRVRRQSPRVWRILSILLIAFAAQVGVGGLNVLLKLPIVVRGLHLALAALVWAVSVLLVARLSRTTTYARSMSRDRVEAAKAS
jgi:heme A synthase